MRIIDVQVIVDNCADTDGNRLRGSAVEIDRAGGSGRESSQGVHAEASAQIQGSGATAHVHDAVRRSTRVAHSKTALDRQGSGRDHYFCNAASIGCRDIDAQIPGYRRTPGVYVPRVDNTATGGLVDANIPIDRQRGAAAVSQGDCGVVRAESERCARIVIVHRDCSSDVSGTHRDVGKRG